MPWNLVKQKGNFTFTLSNFIKNQCLFLKSQMIHYVYYDFVSDVNFVCVHIFSFIYVYLYTIYLLTSTRTPALFMRDFR
jgi:hypothetical protein